ncbi:hypothetical protein [Rubellicoccus peritrichatus]|uniref:Uncharacterized protein n=1 Tax=Rubellicoccus peritrichatus TaxID=3080537 RepID=A0AAQ3L4S1_9BACT|nr:hypothetical protein [Puniceicoccus sp. CR14]WOO39344.1 hypothetical protein RZN69_12030 [Puniceicoccus sp. CR14]
MKMTDQYFRGLLSGTFFVAAFLGFSGTCLGQLNNPPLNPPTDPAPDTGPVYEIVDSDGDGMPDDWEITHDMDPLDATGENGADYDRDSDNLSNLQEYNNTTDPNDADTDDDGLPDGWEVQYGLDPLDNGTTTQDNGAYGDPDVDGLTNITEYQTGTNPVLADTDVDGLPDGWEVLYELDPLDNGTTDVANGANGDPDSDFLDNLGEYQNDTSPIASDTDEDTMPDGWEVSNVTDPVNDDRFEDGDHDGIPNVFEYHHGTEADNADSIPVFSAVQSTAPYVYQVDETLVSETGYEKQTIQTALAAAQSWDIVYVKPGTYTGSVTIDATKQIVLQSTDGAYATVLQGDGTDSPVVSIQGGGFVTGFTIENGQVTGNGGGVYIASDSDISVIASSLIRDNIAEGIGAAIYVESGYPSLINLTIIDNIADGGGAALGVGNDVGYIKASNCIFWNEGSSSMFAGELRFLSIENSIIPSLLADEDESSDPEILSDDPLLAYGGRLTTGSVAVNAGSDELYSLYDLDNEKRDLVANAVDIGVDEFIDTDSDGLPDSWELENSLDHLDDGSTNVINGALGDPDSDGLSNLGEYVHGGDPRDPDTDDDGYQDGPEVFHTPSATDIRNPDTDGDLMWDGWEVTTTLDPLTDDALEDLDLDRYPNVFEYFHGTDANDFSSTPTYSASQTGDYNIYRIDSTLGSELDFEKKHIQTAINAATSHDIVYVLAGEYLEAIQLSSEKPLLLISQSGARQTVINAKDQELPVAAINSESVIDGFTLTGARIAGSGAGISINVSDDESPRILGSVITANIAGNSGGGIQVSSGDPIFTSVTIYDNYSVNDGSALSLGAGATASFYSSILWNDTGVAEIGGEADAVFIKESIIRNDYGSAVLEDASSVDPALGFAGHLISLSSALDFVASPAVPVRYSRFDTDGEWRDASMDAVDAGADEFVDADADGLPDWIESLGISDGSLDFDSDTLTNLAEYESKSSPLLADTDGDGSTDDAEISQGTELLIVDTDGDLMPDGWEVSYSLDPLNATDGFQDADYDQFPNVFEYYHGTDPTSDLSKPVYSASQSGPVYVYEVDVALVTEDDFRKKTIQAAIDVASAHSIILVSAGTYPEAIDLPANSPLLLLSADGAATTILDAQGLNKSVVTVNSESVLDGFTLTHGVTQESGGGLNVSVVQDSLPIILSGAATIRSANSKKPVFANLVIHNNRAGADGGGIAVLSGSPEIIHSTVYRNHVDLGIGAGLYHDTDAGTAHVERSILWNPASADEVGGFSENVSISTSVIRAATGNTVLTQVSHLDPKMALAGHLESTSPAINTDSSLHYTQVDSDGELRDTAVDMVDRGVDEFRDADMDGLPDWLETAGVTDPTSDDDSDTINNLDEYNAGTDPSLSDSDGDGLPDDWENTHSLDPLDSGIVFALNGPLGDPDSDGIGNLIEYTIGTLPRVADTDGDQLPDGWEYFNNLDPLDDGTTNVINGAAGDPDSDALANLGEYIHGGDPWDPDSDDDDYLDGAEVNHSPSSTDLLDADTDDDLMTDGWEVTSTLDPLTDDAYEDLDLDRYPNVFEFFHETDANDNQAVPTFSLTQTGSYHHYRVDEDLVTEGTYEKQLIQTAIGAAAAHDIIEVLAGEYTEALEIPADKPLLLLSQSGARQTIINAALLEKSVITMNSESVLDSFTIRGGRILGSGAGLFINSESNTSPRILGSVITGNFAGAIGGGVHVESGQPLFTNVTVYANYANEGGAAVSVSDTAGASFYTSILWNDAGVPETGGETLGIFIKESIVRDAIESAVLEDSNNIDNPELGYTQHLISTSIALDFISLPSTPVRFSLFDMDGELRDITTDAVDAGADEFIDTDGDGLPDWIETLGVQDTNSYYDSDTLTNLEEYEGGTSPFVEDTDGDMLWDGWEVANGLDPNDDGSIFAYHGAAGDPDADELTNLEEQTEGTKPLDADTDFDGLLDGWEVTYSLDPLDDQGDNGAVGDLEDGGVGDGLINLNEQAAGTHPRDSDSDDDTLPDAWEVTHSLDPLDDGSGSISNGPDGDPDSDTLLNSREYALGTNPRSNDTDGDGLPDEWEIFYQLDPLSITDDDGANGNPDGDIYLNLQEYENGTNPVTIVDNDGDGIADWWETFYGATNPTNDPDNDGLNNLQEYQERTDPNNADTDDDGLPDGWEFMYALSPIDDGSVDVDNGAIGDPDEDGMSNSFEYANELDPQSEDGDNDGLKDIWEITYFKGITRYSTYDDPDGDTFRNLQEFTYGSNPIDRLSIPPEAPDDNLDGETDSSQSSQLISQQSSNQSGELVAEESASELLGFVLADVSMTQQVSNSSTGLESFEEAAFTPITYRTAHDADTAYKYSAWFGGYFVDYAEITQLNVANPYRWIFHEHMFQWLWVQSDSPNSVWIWDNEIGWIWMSVEAYDLREESLTWIYHNASRLWYFFYVDLTALEDRDIDSPAPERWFFRSTDARPLSGRQLSVHYKDSDRLPDFWENNHFSELGFGELGYQIFGDDDDPDFDGLTNLEEYNLDGNPLSRDPYYPEYDNDSDDLIDAWEFDYTGGSVTADKTEPLIINSLEQLEVTISSPSEGQTF